MREVMEMYEGLAKTLRESTPNRRLMYTAADAIEELSKRVTKTEIRTGRWIEKETGFSLGSTHDYVCSECGDYPWWCGVTKEVLPRYCPNCGADMREE